MISKLPITDFRMERSGNVLTVGYREYIDYDCILGKHKTEERFHKIFLK
jgi:hypothetical protein